MAVAFLRVAEAVLRTETVHEEAEKTTIYRSLAQTSRLEVQKNTIITINVAQNVPFSIRANRR